MSILGNPFLPALEEARQLPESAVLIDVRPIAEFASGHIKDAIPLPLDCLAREIHTIVVDPATPIVVYSQSGARADAACHALLRIGYRNVVNGGAMQHLASRLGRPMASVELSAISSVCNAQHGAS